MLQWFLYILASSQGQDHDQTAWKCWTAFFRLKHTHTHTHTHTHKRTNGMFFSKLKVTQFSQEHQMLVKAEGMRMFYYVFYFTTLRLFSSMSPSSGSRWRQYASWYQYLPRPRFRQILLLSFLECWTRHFSSQYQEVMGIKTGICVLLLLCGLMAAHAVPEAVAKRGECWEAWSVKWQRAIF